MRRLGISCACFSMLLVSGVASADGVDGTKGQFIISGERLFGIGIESNKTSVTGGSQTEKQTTISVLYGNSGITAYTIPRVAFDYTVIPSLTIGGSLGIASISPSTKVENGSTTTTTDGASTTAFAFSPRVGYVIGISDSFSIWPRAGITYFHASTDTLNAQGNTDGSITTSGISLDVDAMFAFAIAKNFAIGVAPEINLGVSGSAAIKPDNGPTVSNDFTATHFGAHAAVMGAF